MASSQTEDAPIQPIADVSSHSQASPPLSTHSSYSGCGSGSDSDADGQPRQTRLERPRLSSRKPSGSIVVHKSHQIEIEEEEYPPDDARAMSPRRNSEDLERLGREARATLQEQAKTLQSSLQALAERIDEVRIDHDKLESENKFLQDYIGGLTRTMSKGDLGPGKNKSKK
ncbi:putative bzip transcription factor [Phaeomoniella chlamydospora]|uniref:Putative bzip transcription factor n=1 Tax=Phaeomoniella chlamydospora TaxID=158046 RepID=A0A0G2F491_PHACM|nr:putative bzip transcription factor [Phaeomoniella chlamydospora]